MATVGSIGSIAFEASSERVRTFREYSESASGRISGHDVGGAESVLEWTGTGTRSIELPVLLSASLGVDVEADIEVLTKYSETGELLGMVIGGKPVGGAGAKWIIENVYVTRTAFDSKGRTLLADVGLSLRRARTANTPVAVSQVIEKKNTRKVRA